VTNPRQFELISQDVVYEGRIITVANERYRYPDGEEVDREVVHHQGAVGVVAYDDEHVWLVRQPREPVGDPDVLEIPAGRRDKEGEEVLATAKRELAEEIGKAAEHWEHLETFWTSVGFADEEIVIYLATGLSDDHADSGEMERIEIVPWPLTDLQGAIAASRDSKTLIGLLHLRERLRVGH
jgi:ADP-ribose pyrophosphatase